MDMYDDGRVRRPKSPMNSDRIMKVTKPTKKSLQSLKPTKPTKHTTTPASRPASPPSMLSNPSRRPGKNFHPATLHMHDPRGTVAIVERNEAKRAPHHRLKSIKDRNVMHTVGFWRRAIAMMPHIPMDFEPQTNHDNPHKQRKTRWPALDFAMSEIIDADDDTKDLSTLLRNASITLNASLQLAHNIATNHPTVDISKHWPINKFCDFTDALKALPNDTDSVHVADCLAFSRQIHDGLHDHLDKFDVAQSRQEAYTLLNNAQQPLKQAFDKTPIEESQHPTLSSLERILKALGGAVQAAKYLYYRQYDGEKLFLDWDLPWYKEFYEWLTALPKFADQEAQNVLSDLKWKAKNVGAMLHTTFDQVPTWYF